MLFALLGVSTYGMRAISQSKDKEEVTKNFWNIYSFQLFSSVASLILYIAFVLIFVKDDIGRTVSLIQILYLVGECLNINWFFFGLEKYKAIVMRNIVIKVLTLVSIFVFVRKAQDVAIYVLILALGQALSNIVIWLQLKGNVGRPKISWTDIKVHIKPNIVLFIPVLAASVYHIMDKTMLGMFSDATNSGYYYNADKLLNIPLTVVTGCSTVFMTRTCSLFKKEDTVAVKKTQDESIYFGMCMISAIAFGICAVSREFVPWFFGAGYEPCISLVKYFAVIVILKTVSTHTRSVFLIPESDDKSYAKAIVCGALINLVANYILIFTLSLGALGATLGTLIAEFSVVVTQIAFMKKGSSRKNCAKGILFSGVYLVMGVVMFLALEFIPLKIASLTFRLVIKACIGAAIYLVECVIIWKIIPSLMPGMIKETLVQVKNKVARLVKR
jgi:O-antigen/teichoic acid export membrane protein